MAKETEAKKEVKEFRTTDATRQQIPQEENTPAELQPLLRRGTLRHQNTQHVGPHGSGASTASSGICSLNLKPGPAAGSGRTHPERLNYTSVYIDN